MPIVNDGMTREEADQIAKPAPKGKYLIEINKVFADEKGDVEFESDKGNKMLRFGFKIVSGPYKDGVNLDEKNTNANKLVKAYNAVYGTGFMASFKRAFPDCLTETGAVNTDLAMGLQQYADLKVTTYEGVDSNEINKLYPKNV